MGPEVRRSPAPISRATMWARVVLPSPGGPVKRTWSSGSPRPRAAARKTARFSRTFVWPMYSESVCGRSLGSTATSSSSGVGTRIAFSSVIAISIFSSAGQLLERELQVVAEFLRWPAPRRGLDRLLGLALAIAEVDERRDDVLGRDGRGSLRGRLGREAGGLLRELQHHPLGRLLAHSRDCDQPADVL